VLWKVRVYDQNGRVFRWSEAAFWSMGLLQPADWRAAGSVGRNRTVALLAGC
jgi:alpha-L-rhamnosidase